jgi:hypothetical protein
MLLPMVSTVGPIQRPTNLLLGFVYGLGWFIAGFIDDVRSPNVQTFGSIIWPIVVILLPIYPDKRTISAFVGCPKAANGGHLRVPISDIQWRGSSEIEWFEAT